MSAGNAELLASTAPVEDSLGELYRILQLKPLELDHEKFLLDASPGRQSGSTRRKEQVDAEHRARGNVQPIGLREKTGIEDHKDPSKNNENRGRDTDKAQGKTYQQDQAPARLNNGLENGEEGENEDPASKPLQRSCGPKPSTRPRDSRGRRRPTDTRKGRKYQRRMSNSKSYFWTCVQCTRTGKRDDLRRTPLRSHSLKKYRARLSYG